MSSIVAAWVGRAESSCACRTRASVVSAGSWKIVRVERRELPGVGRISSVASGSKASIRRPTVTCRPKPALSASTRARTRSGCRVARVIATAPPSELPTAVTGPATPAASR